MADKAKGTLRISPKQSATKKKGKSSGKSSSRKSTRKGTKKRSSIWPKVITLGLLVVLVAIVCYLCSGHDGKRGIDVSHHQGVIDWETVGESRDLTFAFVKATEGIKMQDDKFAKNLHGARNAGLLVGAYHFFLPNTNGAAQFKNFAKVVGRDIDLKPVLDLEDAKQKIIDDDYRKEVKSFIDACDTYYGCKPIIYASPSFLKDHGLHDTVKNCPYWIAWYSRAPGFIASRRRFLMMAYPGTHAIMWQFTNRGHHAGIAGDVDLNECWEMTTIEL